MFEKERDIERKLEEARNSVGHQLEDQRPPTHHGREAEVSGDLDSPTRLDETDQAVADGRGSRLSVQPPSSIAAGASDNDTSGAEASSSRRDSSDFVDPRSPAKGRMARLRKLSGSNPIASPSMSTDNGLAPLARIASVLLAPKATPSSQLSSEGHLPSVFSPASTSGTSLMSPQKTPSEALGALTLPPASSSIRGGSPSGAASDGGYSSAQAQPSRGPSPVPPRPVTPPDRRESPISFQPRMELTIMNPDTPSPPTPTRDLFPTDHSPNDRLSRRSRRPHTVNSAGHENGHTQTQANGTLEHATPPRVPSKSHKPPVQASRRTDVSSHSSAPASATGSRAPYSSEVSSSDGYGQSQTPYAKRHEVASVYSRPESSTLTLTKPKSQGHMAAGVSSPLVGYAVAPPVSNQQTESQVFYSPPRPSCTCSTLERCQRYATPSASVSSYPRHASHGEPSPAESIILCIPVSDVPST